MFEFKLPDLGEGVHEGEILKWHVQPGDTIREDDPLLDVETDKAAVTIPSPRSGRVVSTTGKVGDILTVGDVLAVIEEEGQGAAAPAVRPAAAAATPAPKAAAPPTVPASPAPKAAPPAPAAPAAPAAAKRGPVAAAPATRQLARQLGVDIEAVTGTGPAGRVTDEDVRRFAAGGAPAGAAAAEAEEAGAVREIFTPSAGALPFLDLEPLPDFAQWGPVEREPLRSIRRKVARKMATSTLLIPHVGHMDEADVTELEAFRRREKERLAAAGGPPLTLLPFVVKAVVDGLREFPMFNASLDPFRGEIIYKKYYHIGIAVDSGRGLLVPVVKDADRKSVRQIAAEIAELARRGREGKLEVTDFRGGTFTITNVGALGGMGILATINYPECAILGMGRAEPKPVVREGAIVARTMLPLGLSYDHRIADGADGGRFMNALVRRLSEPLSMLLGS